MRKINIDDYANFLFECASFKMFGTFPTIQKQFKEWTGKCVMYGIKYDGQRSILDSKN